MSILSDRLAEKAAEIEALPDYRWTIREPDATERMLGTDRTVKVELTIKAAPGTVTISRDRLKLLMDAEKMLSALEAGGVDNWEGYEFALAMSRQP